jgi:hypothetical protein
MQMEEVRGITDEELIDTFKLAGDMIQSATKKADDAMALAEKIITCMSDAVMGQRRGSYQELLGSKFSADVGPLDEFYSDTFGSKFSDLLLDELLGEDVDDPEAFISGKIGATREKYGKYLPTPSNPNVPFESKPEEPTPADEMGAPPADTPELEGEGPEEEKEPVMAGPAEKRRKKPSSQDMASLLGIKFTSKV